MLELPEYVWEDIQDTVEDCVDFYLVSRDPNTRAKLRAAIDRIIEMVDLERARQIRRSTTPTTDRPQAPE